jgi:hypothetical protein
MSFSKTENRKVIQVLSGRWYQREGGKGVGGEYGGNIMYSCMQMENEIC